MATVILYNIPQLRENLNRSILFFDVQERDEFFHYDVPKKTYTDVQIGHIKDFLNLYQTVTVFDEHRLPPSSYNYVRIDYTQLASPNYFYYYIQGFKELGNNQIEYQLKLDTLMTFLSTDDQVDDIKEALVLREHKKRFEGNIPIFDKYPEAVDVKHEIINTDVYYGSRVRLVYRNRVVDWRPVAYIFTETPVNVPVAGGLYISEINSAPVNWTGGQSPSSTYMWDGAYRYSTDNGKTWTWVDDTWSTYYHMYVKDITGVGYVMRIRKSNGVIDSEVYTISPDKVLIIEVGTVAPARNLYVYNFPDNNIPNWTTVEINGVRVNYENATLTTDTFDDIDIYDAQNERIVEIPFFNIYNLDLRRDKFGVYVELKTVIEQGYELEIDYAQTPFDTSKTNNANWIPFNDPKLYTSQFSPVIINHYGAQFILKRELIKQSSLGSGGTYHQWDFYASVIDSSNFSYKIETKYDKGENVNENKLTYSVNNVIASVKDEAYTYNQYYKDIDEKSLRIKESAALRNATLSTIQQVAGVAGGAMAFGVGGGFNPAQLTSRTVGATISSIATWSDYADEMKQMKLDRERQLTQLLLSQSSIEGSNINFIRDNDDDMLKVYYFEPTTHEKLYYASIFHRFGYQTLEYKKPAFRTRKYFDYKKMVIANWTPNIRVTKEIYDDVVARFEAGVTIYHYNPGQQQLTDFDWDQNKENWER